LVAVAEPTIAIISLIIGNHFPNHTSSSIIEVFSKLEPEITDKINITWWNCQVACKWRGCTGWGPRHVGRICTEKPDI